MRVPRASPELGEQQGLASADLTHPFISPIFASFYLKSEPRRKVRQKVRRWSLCNRRKFLIGALLTLVVIGQNASMAGGPIHGAKAAAMATAFLAVADDPSAILHNPAGLVNLKGTQIYNGATAVIPSSEYDSPDGRTEKTKFQAFLPPHAYLTSDFGLERLVFGLGIYSPFGIGGRKWSDTGLTRYVSTDSLMGTATINPTLAWRVLPQLALGMGVDVLYAFNRMASMVNQSVFGADDAKLSFKGDGFGFGYNLGLLLFPGGKLSFAFAYRSSIRVKQKGDLALEGIAPPIQPVFGSNPFRTQASMVVRFPQIFSWGLAYRPTPQWTIALDAEWVRWSSFSQSTLNLQREVPPVGFTDIPISFKWHDSWLAKIGAEYRISERLALRGGYAFVESPVPERTLGPGSPEANQHNFSVGFGFNPRRWLIDAFYMAGFYQGRTVQNDILSGTYRNFVHYGGMSVGYRF